MGKHKRLFVYVLIFLLVLPLLYLLTVPDVSSLKKGKPGKTAYMRYREKEWKERGKKQQVFQQWVSLSTISPYLVKSVLIAEDDKFWSHEGFDYEAIEKAIQKDLKTGKFRAGGSTITQQLAKNLYLSPAKSLFRKGREAIITWRMEKTLPKRRILELYLNVAEWGEGVFGIEAASRRYYGKPASELTPVESARLASVLPNPRKYHPTGNQSYVINRSNRILDIMIHRRIVIPDDEEGSPKIQNEIQGETQDASGPAVSKGDLPDDESLRVHPSTSLQPNPSSRMEDEASDDDSP